MQERPVLVAPDSFKGTFRAAQVAGAIGRGLERAGLVPPDLLPLADGVTARSTPCSSTSAARPRPRGCRTRWAARSTPATG